jgi:hypothetical protein
VNDHLLADREGWIGGCLDRSRQVDARNQPEFLDDVPTTRDGHAVLVVDGGIVDRNRHITFRQVCVCQVHKFGRLPRIDLADEDGFESHDHLL